MGIVEIILIAVGLAMDAFAVSIACSIALKCPSPRCIFRVAFHFGLFQAFMPVIGWYAAYSAQQYIEAWDHWIAFGLLLIIGGKAIYEALFKSDEEIKKDPTRGLSLVVFSVATSIDALAVGISLAAINVEIIQPSAIIGIVTFGLSVVGMLIGKKLGMKFGSKIEVLGGLILIGIGIKILISHMLVA